MTAKPEADISAVRKGSLYIEWRNEASLESVARALLARGAELKRSNRSETRRVDRWIVKESRRDRMAEVLKHMLGLRHARRTWKVARRLEARGVGVPKPIAYAETRRFGLLAGHTTVWAYLDGCRNIEDYADLHLVGHPQEEIQAYLNALADAVNTLTNAGGFHRDLSGKNIYTSDGRRFYFIDLESVVLGRYSASRRLRNHVQLYDSLLDRWDDSLLAPFLRRMLPAQVPFDAWMDKVRRLQARRRRRILAKWQKTGQTRSRG